MSSSRESQAARPLPPVLQIGQMLNLTHVQGWHEGGDENIILSPPRILTLETAIDFIQDDELIEITPKSIRIRKIHLKEVDRKRSGRN